MPSVYRQSRARKQFDSALSDVLKAIRASHGKKVPTEVRAYVLCAAMVLASASIEAYLEDILSCWCNAVGSSGKTATELPPELRAHLINGTSMADAYKRYLMTGNETELRTALALLFDDPETSLIVGSAPIPTFDAKRIYGKKRYPSVDNIKSMFFRIGIDRIFGKLSRRMSRNAEFELQSFNDVRNQLAHQGKLVGISAADVKSCLERLRRFIGALDREMWYYFKIFPGLSGWSIK